MKTKEQIQAELKELNKECLNRIKLWQSSKDDGLKQEITLLAERIKQLEWVLEDDQLIDNEGIE